MRTKSEYILDKVGKVRQCERLKSAKFLKKFLKIYKVHTKDLKRFACSVRKFLTYLIICLSSTTFINVCDLFNYNPVF